MNIKANCMRCQSEFEVPAGIEQSLMVAAQNCATCTQYYSQTFLRAIKAVA